MLLDFALFYLIYLRSSQRRAYRCMGWGWVLFDHRKHGFKTNRKNGIPRIQAWRVCISTSTILWHITNTYLKGTLWFKYPLLSLLHYEIALFPPLPFRFTKWRWCSASPYVLVSMFTNPFIIALTSVVIFSFAVELYRSTKIWFGTEPDVQLCPLFCPMHHIVDPTATGIDAGGGPVFDIQFVPSQPIFHLQLSWFLKDAKRKRLVLGHKRRQQAGR